MKRISGLFEQICSIDNIKLADNNARKGKTNRYGVIKHDKNREQNLLNLQQQLLNGIYKTSKYKTFKIYEPKERLIFCLPYYPDRIVHHSIMNILEPVWTNLFIANTYSCIKGRGIHKLVKDLKEDLKDINNTQYCLKLDIVKFYPSINHDILKQIIRRKIKDNKLLKLLYNIIDSTEGIPIGNYLSQFFANLYLTYFDHWIKEKLKVKYYYRYADDVVLLSSSKEKLRIWFNEIIKYLDIKLKLKVKSNYQIFPVSVRSIDFVGYKFFHSHVLLRKSIKQNMFKLISKYNKKKLSFQRLKQRICSYLGWLKYCNSKKLLQKIEQTCGISYSNWVGKDTIISNFYDRKIFVYQLLKLNKRYKINFIKNNKSYSFISKDRRWNKLKNNKTLLKIIKYDKRN